MPMDPVCRMVVEETSPYWMDRDRERFYFCSAHCRDRFQSEVSSRHAASVPLGHGLDVLNDRGLEVVQDAGGPSCCHATEGAEQAASRRTAALPRTGYYCVMCEGVWSERPGACPKCGMDLVPVPGQTDESGEMLRGMHRRMVVAVAAAVPVLLLAMLPMVGVDLSRWVSPRMSLWLQLGLTVPAVSWAGWPLWQRGFRSLWPVRPNMFTLIMIGVAAALSYSVAAVLFPAWIPEAFKSQGRPEVYFEAAAVITALVLVGQVLEHRARQRTGSALRELMSLEPPTARRIRDGGTEVIPLEDVVVGDLLRVLPGDRVPVDGSVVEGRSLVDESMMTGEATPVEKSAGETVFGGTINQTGSFQMRAERVGSDTMLARIVDLVRQAQQSRAPIQGVADRVAGLFVPAVCAASLVTFLVWALWSPVEPRLAYALVCGVSVLIIACPCALGLATPLSITVGVGRAAQQGVLIRSAEALERLERIDTLVVDKTGTLTEGRPRVTECLSAGGADETQLLRLAASVEEQSEHPLGRAVVQAAVERGIETMPAEGFHVHVGQGVLARVGGREVLVGSRDHLKGHEVEIAAELEKDVEELRARGRSVVWVAADGVALGCIAVADPIRESTPDAVGRLHAMGIRMIMLTGDNPRTAEAVGRALGIDEIGAGLLPEDKQGRVRDFQQDGRKVAMAGDGINDSPALAAADVGIAMGTGTDVAIESAAVTLLRGDLRGIVRAIELSRGVMRNVRQNLFFAFAYNLLGIPIAAGVLYPWTGMVLSPMVAAAAMTASSLSVVGNALRLRRLKSDDGRITPIGAGQATAAPRRPTQAPPKSARGRSPRQA